MPVTYKLTGFQEAGKAIVENVKKTFNTKIEDIATDYLNYQLNAQIDANNEPMPKKSLSTIKEYQKHGYNTEKFLVRTGESTKLRVLKNGSTMVIQPEGYKILKNLIPNRVEWMVLNDEVIAKIREKFLEELRKEFK